MATTAPTQGTTTSAISPTNPTSDAASSLRRSLFGQHSLRVIAARAHISHSHLGRALRGERRLSMPAARSLATALGITLDKLYDVLHKSATGRRAGNRKTKGKAKAKRRTKR